jgi:uncharacterized repeat protein (TIGR01451 family)
MSQHVKIGCAGPNPPNPFAGDAVRGRAMAVVVATVVWILGTAANAQDRPGSQSPAPPVSVERAPAAPAVTAPGGAPGTAEIGPPGRAEEHGPTDGAAAPGGIALDPDIQIVRFQGMPGLAVEVLAPAPEPVPQGDGGGIRTVGLKRGVGYRLRVTGIPERPGAELFPVIEVVGHLHRPADIEPAKYPIRVVFNQDDLDDAVDHGRLVTKVIYLEDPEQAIPFKLPKDQVPVLTLNPTEPPLRVASALGRPVAIVRMGGRRPTGEEIQLGMVGDSGLEYAANLGGGACPFVCGGGARCPMPSGPVCTAAPLPTRPSLPRDEYLCDGGDRAHPAAPGSNGTASGVDPRDAIVQFDIGLKSGSRTRILPTNVVCVYAPRFAEVRVSTGTNQNVDIQTTRTDKSLSKHAQSQATAEWKRLVQNQAPELARNLAKPAGLKGRLMVSEGSNNRGPSAYSGAAMTVQDRQTQTPELARNRQKVGQVKVKIRLDGIKSAESPVATGIVQGASEAVRVWAPHAMTGVEAPPERPGLAVIKRVSAVEAEPGDTLTYVIIYRNMGNTPIRAVSIVDSLLPRLEYVKGTARGPEGTTFSTADNSAGSSELTWYLPGVLAPGAVGHVSFQAIVR